MLLTKGLKGFQIANELQVDPATISRDIHYLSKEPTNVLNSLVKDTIPFMYQTSMEGIKKCSESWKVYSNEINDDRLTWSNRLKALDVIKSCYESLFKLVSEGPSHVYMKTLEERLEKMENNNNLEN